MNQRVGSIHLGVPKYGVSAYGIGRRSEAPVTTYRRHRLFQFPDILEDALATVTLFSTHSTEHGFKRRPAVSGHRAQIDSFGWVQREFFSKRSFFISKRLSYIRDSQRHLSGATARTFGVLNEVLAPLKRQL